MGHQREPNPGEAARNAQPYYIDPDRDGWKADARAEQRAAEAALENDAPAFAADCEAIDGRIVLSLSRDSAELLARVIVPVRANMSEGYSHALAISDALGREVRHMDRKANPT